MLHKTPRQLREMICTPGYYRKRKKYFRKRNIYFTALASDPQNPCAPEALDNAIRCYKKADWYRRRECFEPIMEKETVLEIVLTEEKFIAMTKRLYFSYDSISRTFCAKMLKDVFNIEIPEDW